MITVYAFSKLPPAVIGVSRDLRVLWALEELGLSYSVKALDLARGDLRSPDYVRINPFAAIPAIEDDGFKLFESGAIVLYLAEKAKKLMPAEPQARILATQWILAAVNTVEPAMTQLLGIDKFSTGEAWAVARRPAVVEIVQRRLASLDAVLAARPYVMGNEFTAPDILMSAVLRIVQHTDLLAAVPHVSAYKARCEDRPAFKKAYGAYEKRVAA